MPSPVPDNAHDAAAWLLRILEAPRPSVLEPDLIVGVLPSAYDLSEIDSMLLTLGPFYESANSATREISFLPQRAGIYASLDEMLRVQVANQSRVPEKFSLTNIGYVHGIDRKSLAVEAYLDATTAIGFLKSLSDFSSQADWRLHFTLSAEKKLSISLSYTSQDLRALPGIADLWSQFVCADVHAGEKRIICRQALFDVFKGSAEITVAEFFLRFEEWSQSVRSSYAMFMERFSSDTLRVEVDKLNSDDMLRLNKTFSEIQNQLLAIPAALLVVGASVEQDNWPKNLSIVFGTLIFTVFMWLLIRNQENSVSAISAEICVRQRKLEAQPEVVSAPFVQAFTDLAKRVAHQMAVLSVVKCALVGVGLFVLLAVTNAQVGGGVLPQLIKLGRAVMLWLQVHQLGAPAIL